MSPLQFFPLSSHSRMVALLMGTCLISMTACATTKEDYRSLLAYLFTNYSRDIRPVNDFDDATEIFMTLGLLSILEVNEKEQTLKTNTILEIEWVDEYLAWDPGYFANITSTLMRQKGLWLPDIVVSNTVTSQKELGYDNLKLRISAEGLVTWSPSGIIETACDIDITYYPFDTQVCEVIFKTAMSRKTEIYVLIDRSIPIDTSQFSPNGLWILLNSSAENSLEDDFAKTTIKFKLQLQRRRSYYILNIVLPILFLSVTSSLTFALPSDAGEKMGLSITVLLAYAVYLTLVTDSMPDTSTQVAVVTVYLVLLLAVTSASVVLSVLILRLHHRPPSSPVTGCLATVTVTLRGLLCMEPLLPGVDVDRQETGDTPKERGAGDRELTLVKLGNPVMVGLPRPDILKRPPRNVISPGGDYKVDDDSGSRSRRTKVTTLTCGGPKVKGVSGQKVAETWDKFIFLLFTSISVCTTVICLVVLAAGASKQERDTALT